MSPALLTASHLDIGYGHKRVGRGIELRLHANEVVCLLGPNGSGKSTLFRTLLGLQKPLDGQIQVQGRDLAAWPARQLARQLAYVPQAVANTLMLTAEEMVMLGRAGHLPFFALPGHADREAAQQALASLGIADLSPRLYPQLSGGEKQLVLIARALVQRPAALIMDEPTASLDFGNQLRVLKQMRALADRGMGLLFCTHQPEHAQRIADRVLLFREGRIQASGSPATLLTPERLAWLYDLDPNDL